MPVLLRWTNGLEHYDKGYCANLGEGGMFILTAKSPPGHVEIEVEFVLPAFGLVQHPLRLRCVGRVSRIEACYQLNGFAVAGRFLDETVSTGTTSMATADGAA